jgi:hypothetical protein
MKPAIATRIEAPAVVSVARPIFETRPETLLFGNLYDGRRPLV